MTPLEIALAAVGAVLHKAGFTYKEGEFHRDNYRVELRMNADYAAVRSGTDRQTLSKHLKPDEKTVMVIGHGKALRSFVVNAVYSVRAHAADIFYILATAVESALDQAGDPFPSLDTAETAQRLANGPVALPAGEGGCDEGGKLLA
jgi:hypothetical protein